MTGVIQFLETMGRKANLRYASKPTLHKAMSETSLDQHAQWAILRGDHAKLKMMLNARTELVCLIVHPDGNATEDVKQEVRVAANAA